MDKCKIEGCLSQYKTKREYCNKHYLQMQRHGKILSHTNYDPNEFIIEDKNCFICLYNKNGEIKAKAKLDLIDYNKVKEYRWTLNKNGYVTGKINDKRVYISHFILETSPDIKNLIIDHIDGNPLNNTRNNLRICTARENAKNTSKKSNNTSGYKGVYWDKNQNKWRARIKVDYKGIHLGSFHDKITAAKEYNIAALKYFGEFAKLNIIEGE